MERWKPNREVESEESRVSRKKIHTREMLGKSRIVSLFQWCLLWEGRKVARESGGCGEDKAKEWPPSQIVITTERYTTAIHATIRNILLLKS